MAKIESPMNLSAKSTRCSTELIEANGWGELVQSGTFEPEKALMSLEATTRGYLSNLPHQTIQDIEKTPTVSLATLKKYRGEAKMIVTLCALIVRASEMLNVGKSMSDVQIQETAKMIFSDYYFLTLGDFRICFSNGIKGKYGQLYDRFDASIIFEWLSKYSEERAEYFSERRNQQSLQVKNPENAVPMPPDFMEKINEFLAKNKKAVSMVGEKTANVKFSTLSAFLESIGKDGEENKDEILELWRSEYEAASIEIEFDSFCLYKSNQILNLVNTGKISTWEDLMPNIHL